MTTTQDVTREKLGELATSFLSQTMKKIENDGLFVALYGDLGAGKTSFVKEVARLLGIHETVISPTFILKKEYGVDLLEIEKLVHVDAYRFEEEKEGEVLALSEDKKPKTLVFVEWPERLGKQSFDVRIQFMYKDENTRTVTFHFDEKKD